MFGTTLGMLLANVPVVLIGKAAAAKIPFKAVRIAAALLFAALGVYALVRARDGRGRCDAAPKNAPITSAIRSCR